MPTTFYFLAFLLNIFNYGQSLDLNQTCLQKGMSAYVDGICYQLQAIYKNQSLAKTTCGDLGGRLAIIRSTDVAEKMINIFRKTYPSFKPNFEYYFWIGAPNDDKYEYNSLNLTNSTDNTYTMSVQLYNLSACPVLDWSTTYSNFAFIKDFSPCNFTGSWFFCEYIPTFKQLGCQQTLAAGSAITVEESLSACTVICAENVWCAGVNYQSTTGGCQQLVNNTSVQNLTIACSWDYYERII